MALRSIFKMNAEPISLGIGLVLGSNGSVEDRRHYFVPDFYDSTLTVVGPDGCPGDDKRTCSFERGQILWDNLSNEISEISASNAFQSQRESLRRLRQQNATNTLDVPVVGRIDVHDHGGIEWQVQDQLIRRVSGSSPWRPVIGLSKVFSVAQDPQRTSFIENFSSRNGLPSLSWSYTFNTPDTGKIQFF